MPQYLTTMQYTVYCSCTAVASSKSHEIFIPSTNVGYTQAFLLILLFPWTRFTLSFGLCKQFHYSFLINFLLQYFILVFIMQDLCFQRLLPYPSVWKPFTFRRTNLSSTFIKRCRCALYKSVCMGELQFHSFLTSA